MASRPLQIFRFDDSVLPTTATYISESVVAAPPSNATVQHPGEMMEIGSSFLVYDQEPLKNNRIEWQDGNGVDRISIIAPGLYSGSELATEWQSAMQVHDPNQGLTYHSVGRTFRFTNAQNFKLYWATQPPTERVAYLMGFDNPLADSTGAPAYTSTNAVFVRNYQLAGWLLNPDDHLGYEIERIMVYATNLGSSDTIQMFGDPFWKGVHPEDWSTAAFVGELKSATNSRSNDLYTWEVGGTLIQGLAMFVNRGGNPDQFTMANLKVGCIGVWRASNFNGADYDRQIRSAFESRRVVLDTVDQSGLGGNVDQGIVRGYREVVMAFGGWDETAYLALDTYLDKYRTDPALWIPDPDHITTDNTVYGFVPPGGWSGVQWRGTQFVRDMTLQVQGARMQAE